MNSATETAPNAASTDEPSPESSGRSRRPGTIWLSIIQLVWVLVLYVASAGPLYWRIYAAYHLDGSPFLARLYLPLALACRYCPPLASFMDWYVGLWVL